MDVRAHCNTFNRGEQKYINMMRPTDKGERVLFTYLVTDDNRLRLDIAPHPRSVLTTLLGNIQSKAARKPLAFCKRVHRYTHATKEEMERLCSDAKILDPPLRNAIERVVAACEICAKNGAPKSSRKVSLTHVNEGFNQEIQIDFFFFQLRGNKYTIMNITDTGTGYSELSITNDRSMNTIIRVIETGWICNHGAPKAVSDDDEYNKLELRNFLAAQDTEFKPRPARRHNKIGLVERKNGVVKTILGRLDDEPSNASPTTLVARAAFLSNLFSGNSLLSSFELVRGYCPSILGTPRKIITEELLQAHREQVALRTLQRLFRTKMPDLLKKEMFNRGDPIWVFYRTSKQNEKVKWVRATVVDAKEHFITARRSSRGPPMRVAYEDVRLSPRSELTAELLSCTLEEEIQNATTPSQALSPPDDDVSPDIPHPLPASDQIFENDTPSDSASESQHTPIAESNYPTSASSPPNDNPSSPLRLRLNLRQEPDNTKESLIAYKKEGGTIRHDGGVKDIGLYATAIQNEVPPCQNITRDNSRELQKIIDVVGNKQVTANQLSFAPPWILQEALQSEHDSNWKGAYTEVYDVDVPRNANIITSHVVYKVKTEEDGTHKMKGRIVPHGNHDNEKEDIRKDSSNAPLFIVRLLLSLVTFLGFHLGTADIKGAFLQSGPIKRDIYVRPPREWNTRRGILWKLLKLPYGIADAGRQWQLVVEDWMLNQAGLERVFGLSQLFAKRAPDGTICLLVAKVTDDFLLGGSVQEIERFVTALSKRFVIGKVVINQKVHFDGCEIEQHDDGSIKMSMIRYLDRLKPISLSRSRKKQRQEKATDLELKQYRSLAATLMYLGNGVLPQASYVTSTLQQAISRVNVEQLVTANNMLSELMNLKPWITFRKPPQADQIRKVFLSTFSDASFNQTSSSGYGQTGLLAGLRIELYSGLDLFHPIDWCSHKQRRVSYSPYGAEILACADADDRGFYFKSGFNSLFKGSHVRNELYTDLRCLYDTITTLHEGRDFRLRPTVQRMRNSFDSKELDCMRWIPGPDNPADALTKRNPNTSRILNELTSAGIMCIDIRSGYQLDSATWQ